MLDPCPPPHILETLADPDRSLSRFRSHAENCPACRAQIDEIRANQAFLRNAAGLLRAAGSGTTPTEVSREPRLAAIPATVPGYELLEEINRGGQGVVYRAVQVATKRPAAVKMLLWGAFSTVRQQNRFEREIEIAARLRDPNIVTIFESGVSTDGRRYVAMEYVEGRPLDRFVQAEFAALSPRERTDRVLELVAKVASALGHAHASGVIHRDIKPSNILVDSARVPRVLDFGLARELESLADGSLTQEFVGTPAYASPEQFAGDPGQVDARSDVYSLGVVLYQALTGTHPYPCNGSLAATIEHVRSTDPAPPSRHVPRLPADVDVMLLQALAKDPSRRYATAQALAADLEDFRAGRPISARRDSTLYVLRKLAARHRVPFVAGGIMLCVIVAAVVVLALLSRSLDRQRRIAESALAESNLHRGRLLVRTGGTSQAEQLLWREANAAGVVASEQLGFEDTVRARRASWALLELYSKLPRLTAVQTDGPSVRVGFSDDGRRVWSVSAKGALEHWTIDGAPVGQGSRIDTTAQAGRLLVTRDGCRAFALESVGMRLFDLGAGGAGVPLSAPEPDRLAVGDDGRTIVALDFGESARVIDTDSGLVLATLSGDFTNADLQGDILALTSATGGVELHLHARPDWKRMTTLRIPATRIDRRVRGACAVSSDRRFAVVQFEASVYLFGLPEGGSPLVERTVQSPLSTQPRFAPDGRDVLTITQDGTFTRWSVPDLSPLRVIRSAHGPSASEFREPWVVTGGSDGSLAIWHICDDPWPRRLPGSTTTTHGFALHPDGELLVAGDDHGVLTLLRVGPPHSVVARFEAHARSINAIDFSPAGDRFATAGQDGGVRIWGLSGERLADLSTGGGEFWCARFSPDGRHIAASSGDGGVLLWDAMGRSAPRHLVSHPERVPTVAFSSDSRFCVSVSVPGDVVIWDVASAEAVCRFGVPCKSTRVAVFAPDGRTVAVGADDRTIRFWDARTGALLGTIDDLPWGPFDLQYHPDGRILFAVGRGNEIVVVDTETFAELATFPAHERLIFKLRLDRAGRRLFTAGEDNWLGVWDTDHLRRCVRGNAAFHAKRMPQSPGR